MGLARASARRAHRPARTHASPVLRARQSPPHTRRDGRDARREAPEHGPAREGARVFAADLTAAGSLAEDQPADDFIQLDVTSEDSVRAAFDHVAATADGRLDILVNAAGIEIEKTIEETSLEEWNRIFAVNVTGTFLVSKYALPLLRRSQKKTEKHWHTSTVYSQMNLCQEWRWVKQMRFPDSKY